MKSTNNSVEFLGFNIDNEVFVNQPKRKKKKVNAEENQEKVDSESYIIEVQGTEENEDNLFQKMAEEIDGKMQETLKKNMNFVKTFVGFIHAQIRKL